MKSHNARTQCRVGADQWRRFGSSLSRWVLVGSLTLSSVSVTYAQIESETPAAEGGTPAGPIRGGDFSLDRFESAQFNDKVKGLQAQQSKIRVDSINKLETLIRQNPYYPGKADIYFRLAEYYWDEQKYKYLLTREEYDKQVEAFSRGTLSTEPTEPLEDYSVSLEYYRKILQEFPDYPRIDEVIYYLGRGALKQGKERTDRELTKEGVSFFQKLVQNYPSSRFIAESHLALAEHYFENNSLYYAKTNYEKIINNFKDSPMFNYALYKLGWVYFNLAEFRKSINTFKEVVKIVGKGDTRGMIEFKDQALRDLVVCYAEIPDGWKEAREYFIDQLGDKEAYKKLRALAELYVGQDKDEEAIDLYTHFIEHDGTDPLIPEYFENIIAVIKKLNDFGRTEAKIREMIAFFDKDSRWWLANKNNEEAATAADTMVEGSVLFLAQHYHKLAQSKNQRSAFEQAAKDYNLYLTLYPNSKNAYLVNFYYAEILYDPLNDYEQAITQYNKVIERDKKGDYLEDASIGIIYSYEQLMRKNGLREDTGKSRIKVVKLSADEIKKREGEVPRTELHELERGYVDAADMYVKLLGDLIKDPAARAEKPERGERIPEIMYIAALVYYEHGQYKEAVDRLQTIFAYNDQHEYAAYAVNTMLDCYVRLRFWTEIDEWASRLIAVKNFKVKSQKELNRIRAIAKAEKARDFASGKQFDAAIDENMSVYKEFKASSPELASTALYNVGAIHERAKRYPDAIQTYLRVVKEFPKEEIAPDALVTIGLIYESQTQFPQAAETLESMTAFPKHPRTPEAIQQAGLIREALEDYNGAISSYRLYLKTFGGNEDAPLVDRQIGLVFESMDTPDGYKKAADHFEGIAKRYAKSADQIDLVVESLSRAGQNLKRVDKVKNRKAVEKLLSESLKTFARIPNPSASKARPYAAQAALELAEYIYDDFYAAQVDTANFRTLKKTLLAKAELQQKTEVAYVNVLEYKAGGSTACSLFRIGQIYYDFSKALFDVPIPDELPPEVQDDYVFALEQLAAPLEEKSLTAFVYALGLALDQGVYNDCSKNSATYAAKVNPDRFPVSSEPAVQPTHEKDTLLSPNFIRSLRRGDVEVEFVEIQEENKRGVDSETDPE